jgi:hypothetical protein
MSVAEGKAKPRKPTASEGRRELKDILASAKAVSDRRLNPFHLDVADALETADRYFPAWDAIDDLTLDARALNALGRVLQQQEGRLKYQAQLFHADPEAMAEKLTQFKADQLAKVFLGAWHPIVELEQLTPQALGEAIAYWQELETVEVRRRERPRKAPPAIETLTLDDLMAKGIVPKDTFGHEVAQRWEELQERGPTAYTAFIEGKDRTEKVARAYATSYLVTYGYAYLEQSNGSLTLVPRKERTPPGESVSLPIVVTV